MSKANGARVMTPAAFLRMMIDDVADEDYVFLGIKDWKGGTGKFHEINLRASAFRKTKRDLDKDDLYFCPNGFSDRKRQRGVASGKAQWLYADLDAVDPYGLDIKPTVAWETSPGNFQAAWRIQPLGPRAFERLNKALTYHVKADRGGWSWTKYLRLPGTTSYKHEEPFLVRTLWTDGPTHDVQALRRIVKAAIDVSDPASGPIRLPDATGAQIARKYWAVLPAKARKLIRAPEVRSGDDRSAKMWDLHKACAQAGMSTGEQVRVVQACVYNKYRGQRREVRQLWTEAEKARMVVAQLQQEIAIAQAPREEPVILPDPEPIDLTPKILDLFKPIRVAKYLAMSSKPPSWLVQDVWSDGAHGLWAGDYKTYKSTLLIDFALSVASGLPFLGVYDVPRRGPVLMVQEENSPSFMVDKLHRVMASKTLSGQVEESNDPDNPIIKFGKDINLHLMNQRRFDLTDDEHQRWLAAWIEHNRPRAVILDPLYRIMQDIDENSGGEVAPFLGFLATLSAELNTAIVLVHHYNKPNEHKTATRRGHRVSGTGMFNRWWASSVYSERTGESHDHKIRLAFEHREHPDVQGIRLTVRMDEDDPDDYEPIIEEDDDEDQLSIDLQAAKSKRKPHRKANVFVPINPVPIPPRHQSNGLENGVDIFDAIPLGYAMAVTELVKETQLTDSSILSRADKSQCLMGVTVMGDNGRKRRAVLRHSEP